MDIIRDIARYVVFLKKQCGLYISIHPSPRKETMISSGALMRFNLHENSYCAFIKQHPLAKQHCIDCQKKVLAACDGGPFCGVCFAGVAERVYPITDGETITGFISVSGYQTEQAIPYLQKLVKRYGFALTELTAAYGTLKADFPSEEHIDTLLLPLCHMLQLAYEKDEKRGHPLPFACQVEQYIRRNRNQDISSQAICRHFSCSRSYMSTAFNKFKGKSIRDFVNQLRMEDARELLQNTNLTVTEIAYTIGFNSSTYFSKLFKQSEKCSPLQYRKASRQ